MAVAEEVVVAAAAVDVVKGFLVAMIIIRQQRIEKPRHCYYLFLSLLL